MAWFAPEEFTDAERAVLAPYFTNLDGAVFALVNLPEVTKGALFARYSRSPKSLRRLFLDEFAEHAEGRVGEDDVGVGRAEDLYQRVFVEYGDDSVAQLGGVHLACEQSSQVLAKVLEWGRLAAYLEQSTRYVPYDDRPGGRWRYAIPPEVEAGGMTERFAGALDRAFEIYASWVEPMQAYYRERYPKDEGDSEFVYRSTIRAKALDALRGLLPAATRSNVGIYATGQAYEQLLLRMAASPLAEVREYAGMMLIELRKVIPAFLRRVDVADRGVASSEYLRDTRKATDSIAADVLAGAEAEPRPEVALTDFDPDGETKVIAAALYSVSDLPDDQLLAMARRMSADERASVLRAYVGTRTNRRHRPGRAFERTGYRFDVLCDYGAFRDLQRHRLLTIEWQELSPRHGFVMPPEIVDAGADRDWARTMDESAALWTDLRQAGVGPAAQYAVSMAYRIRFVMQMNAREAMHLIELRTTPQGHPAYRRVGQAMHRLIAEEAGHRGIAEAIRFADHSSVELERLEAERRTDARRRALGTA
ncbi:MAG TPA: FAD-dependent thymidylate synthase [Actinomycetota bacterium]|nr:FAD-dependent thymidylate synthase [Actinomycetota bacterium]